MGPNRILAGATAVLIAGAVVTRAEQARRPAGGAASATVKVALKAAGEAVEASGSGTCTHAPKAAIYGTLSEMWMVRQQGESRSVQLTLWKPADGKDSMFSLSVNGRKSLDVSTVRGGTVSGSGAVTFKPSGGGGTFTVDAKTRSGEAITGTIECSAFAAAVAEGG